jgi:hypothetical protein
VDKQRPTEARAIKLPGPFALDEEPRPPACRRCGGVVAGSGEFLIRRRRTSNQAPMRL